MKKRGKVISFILTVALALTTVCMPMTVLAAQSDSLIATKVTITNNADATKDVIYITSGTRSGDIIRVYQTNQMEKMLFQSGIARGSSFRFEIPAGILDDSAGGSIFLTVTGTGKTESDPEEINYSAAPKSLAPIEKNIVVTNNVQIPGGTVYDRVNITGLRSGDIFYVYYEDPTSGVDVFPAGFSSAATTKGMGEAVLKNALPDTGAIWITVRSTGRTESDPVSVAISAVDTSETPIMATATNNYGSGDKIMVTGLYPGDEVQAMEASTGVVYGSGKVSQKKTDIEISAKANRTGLLPSGGSIIIKVTTAGKKAVTAGPFPYEGEVASSPVAVAPQSEFNGNVTSCGSVMIYNYENKLDQIVIGGLLPGDQVLVTTNPEPPQKEAQLKAGTVGAKDSVFKSSIKLPEIAAGNTTGSIRIYVTSIGMERSAAAVVEYSLSLQSEKPEDLTGSPGTPSAGIAIRAITNSAVKNGDSILVTGVTRGEKIFIYENPTAPMNGTEMKLNALGSGTVSGSKAEIVVSAQFPEKGSGDIYVSYTKPGLQESERVKVSYGPEKQTSLSGISFVALNLAGYKDTLTITGAPKNAIIQAYTTTGAQYVNTFIKGSYVKINSEKPVVATFALPDIPSSAPTGSGVIYIGVTYPGESESDLIPVYYDPEPLQAWDTSKLTAQAVNIFGPLDYVVFSQPLNPPTSADMEGVDPMTLPGNLYPGHTLATAKTVITVYASMDPNDKTRMGSMTVNSQYPVKQTAGGDYYLERVVNIKALNVNGGVIAYTLTYPGKAESARMPVSYGGESQTQISLLDAANRVNITNNINTGLMPDYVDISIGGIVTAGSVVKVYNSKDPKATLLGKATITDKIASEASIRIALSGKYALTTSGGSVWITVQEAGKSESDFVEVAYNPEGGNQTPDINAISMAAGQIYAIAIDNKPSLTKDYIFICGLEPEDIATLTYQVSDEAKAIVRTERAAAGQSTVTFSISIPEAAWTNGFITVTRKGMFESNKVYLSTIKKDGAPK